MKNTRYVDSSRVKTFNITLDTFSDVECHYNSVDVLVSKYHSRAQDIRPIADRRRKWERISKTNDREFVLQDGYLYGQWGAPYLKRPPITWNLQKGAVETITVRGAVATQSNDTSRHNFLREYLPNGLVWEVGAQANHAVAYFNVSTERWDNIYLPHPLHADDATDYAVQFQRTDKYHDQCGHVWEHVGGQYQKQKRRVDKETKAALKPDIHAFFEWMCSVGPLLPTDRKTKAHFKEEILEVCRKRELRYFRMYKSYGYGFNIPAELAREIITDYNHMLRPHLAAQFLDRNDIKEVNTPSKHTKFKAAYNKWVNRNLGLIKQGGEK